MISEKPKMINEKPKTIFKSTRCDICRDLIAIPKSIDVTLTNSICEICGENLYIQGKDCHK